MSSWNLIYLENVIKLGRNRKSERFLSELSFHNVVIFFYFRGIATNQNIFMYHLYVSSMETQNSSTMCGKIPTCFISYSALTDAKVHRELEGGKEFCLISEITKL